jgi:CheY-like chemotaxis protein
MGRIRQDDSHSFADNRTLHILIVDDCPDYRDTMALLLRALGHDVQTAPDGSAALRMALEDPPDIVLLDIGLPGIRGYELARRLRAVANRRRPFIVAVTGYSAPSDLWLSEEAGIDRHLVKPVDFQVICDALAEHHQALDPGHEKVLSAIA